MMLRRQFLKGALAACGLATIPRPKRPTRIYCREVFEETVDIEPGHTVFIDCVFHAREPYTYGWDDGEQYDIEFHGCVFMPPPMDILDAFKGFVQCNPPGETHWMELPLDVEPPSFPFVETLLEGRPS